MALWGAGGDSSSPAATLPLDSTPGYPHDAYFAGGKHRVSCGEGSDYHSEWIQHYKRPRHADVAGFATDPAPVETFRAPAPARDVAFFVRPCQPSPAPPLPYPDLDRGDLGLYDPGPDAELDSEPVFDYAVEHGLPSAPSPLSGVLGAAPAMERTASGLSISSGLTHTSSPAREPEDFTPLGDLEAAQHVRDHLAAFTRRSRGNSRHERILRALINPRTRGAAFPIDDAALASIFSAANAVFFAGRLSNRVAWDWSHESAPQYTDSVIGTTALRRCEGGLAGFETLIVLSRPILMGGGFSRRLLISTFLHELIHSYLFVSCGFKAKESGGHTEGFHQIAAVIDCWAGPELLRLREMEADLESYREEGEASLEGHGGLQSRGSPRPYEQAQQEVPFTLPGSEARHPRATAIWHSDDNHIPILREQPHRLLQSRSQTSLRRRLHDELQPLPHAHQQHSYTHREAKRHRRPDEAWEGRVEDRWHGDRPVQERSSASSSIPILVRVSVPETVPIRASLEVGAVEAAVYAEYD